LISPVLTADHGILTGIRQSGGNSGALMSSWSVRLILLGICAATCSSIALASSTHAVMRNSVSTHDPGRSSFNAGWRFFLGEADGADQPQFDDSHWLPVRLPHDWAIAGSFDPALNPHTGALSVSGTGWYRKTFAVPGAGTGRTYRIEFDGAMANSRVWLNGHQLGTRPYGYIGFFYDLTPYLVHDGRDNVLSVRLTPEGNASRWYPGAGLYRNVWLVSSGTVHVAHWGTAITTPLVTAQSAAVEVRTQLDNQQDSVARIALRTSIIDQRGRRVAGSESHTEILAQNSITLEARLRLRHPERWSLERPYLYTVLSEVLQGTELLDRYESSFGVRVVSINREHGVRLNGRRLKLQGVCLHHDLGALGAAVNRRATERELQILKAAGVNAIRTSHNPPSPELLEFADRLGLLVIDEAFDMWRTPKVPNGYSKYFDEWSERDLRDMVRRDRNHPSIIMWSIGNEVPEQGEADGWRVARRLTRLFHDSDPTRPTTAAFNSWQDAIRNGLAAEVDIPGFNYTPTRYGQILKDHPHWVIYGSETASCVSSRGIYHLPLEKYAKHASLQLSSYDIIAPPWAYCPDVEFAAQEANPEVLGEFVWTGFDYLGEPTPYFGWEGDNSHDWPAHSSYFGMVDLAGFPKDRYYLYQSQWTRAPMVHVLPHWNWPGHEGQPIPVMIYSNADEVELFLNARSLGRQRTFSRAIDLPAGPNVSQSLQTASKYRLLWQVPYEAGSLHAVAYRHGVQVAEDTVRTAGTPTRIRLLADRSTIAADGDDLAFVTVRIEDQAGSLCPLAEVRLNFQVSGVGRNAGVDNGNPATLESFRGDTRSSFSGLALLIVGSRPGEAGAIHVSASADGLASGELDIDAH
jgi:beta-galactosidase